MNLDKLTLTVGEAAKLLGIGRQLAYDQVRTGRIPSIRVGRRLLVPRRSLEKFLDSSENQQTEYKTIR
jgi:excisionase family DNA binding protein